MWRYKSPIGEISIVYLPSQNKYGTVYNGIIWETCKTPEICADNVYCHCTGCFDWDMLDGKVHTAPTDLSEWEKD